MKETTPRVLSGQSPGPIADGAPPFTGEFCVPGQTGKRIERDHLARYEFASRYAEGGRVLDAACGVGYGSRMLRDAGATEVIGVDINPQLVNWARHRYARDGLEFQVADVCQLPFTDEFDLVTSFETIEHVTDYQAALHGMHAALRPGGTLIISTPNRHITSPRAMTIDDKPTNPFHVREFALSEFVAALAGVGFDVGADQVFGQRLRRVFGYRLLRWLQWRLLNPNTFASPRVKPVGSRAPRYIVVVAHKRAPARASTAGA